MQDGQTSNTHLALEFKNGSALQCVGSGACGFAAWALWEGGAGETSSGRAGLCALAVWGGALALAALASLTGAARNSGALLAAAVALLALTAAAEAAAAWWGAAHLPHLRAALLQRLDRTVRYDYGVLPARTHLVDAIQQGLECCGSSDIRDWQSSVWARTAEGAGGAGAAPGEAEAEAAPEVLDLSVSAPARYYSVPASCCQCIFFAKINRKRGGHGLPDSDGRKERDVNRNRDNYTQSPEAGACAAARRVPAAGGRGAGLHARACGPRVLRALGAGARGPLWAGAALLGVHALAALLALALAVRARPRAGYKA
ncbi:unnamed protein product [Diatraea saccharalis]|uniref:Tetraspanin n=1 Tax=Diatraea saccharalis TaxID=40085 RepID=A0A9N9R224_9NEOP|nr:unnamed protein product [Diatraea saccharalis]